jgi:hypothetical protein
VFLCIVIHFSDPGDKPIFSPERINVKVKVKLSLLTGRGGPYVCEKSRLPHFLDNRLTDGGEVVSLTRRPPLPPRNIPDTHFC